MSNSEIILPVLESTNSLIVINKYRTAFEYIYPLLINISNKHKILKDTCLNAIIEFHKTLHDASKSNVFSKINTADTNLAYIKELMSILASDKRKLISRHQYEVSTNLLSETGAIIGHWKKKVKQQQQKENKGRNM